MMKKLITFIAFVLVVFTANAQVYNYDVNGDGFIDISDVTCLVNKILDVSDPGETPQSYLSCPDSNHPHLIDLGLPSGTKWSCCNVGANKPEAHGGYYSWGETKEKYTYDWSTYTHCDGSSSTCHDLGNDIIGMSYDVAQALWGGSWLMPTIDHIEELLNNCTYEWTMLNGETGCKFTSKKNGSSIFLPAAGKRYNSVLDKGGMEGNYWSSTQHSSYSDQAHNLRFDSDLTYSSRSLRYYGANVRPVVVKCESLQVSSNELSLIIGQQGTVEINSGSGYYNLQTSDTNIATATLSSGTVTVTAVSRGKATITVTDRLSRETATIEVTAKVQSYFTCPDDQHPHLIDLGLPSGTKWACCNVGADKPEDYGGYYAWGETEERNEKYNWDTYIYCDGTQENCFDLGSDIAGTEYDVAHEEWGDYWVMPTIDHAKELLDNCTYEWTMWNGVRCGKLTSKINGVSIYLPVAGEKNELFNLLGIYDVGSTGVYWSSTKSPDQAYGAVGFKITSDEIRWYQSYYRCNGHSIRPIVTE